MIHKPETHSQYFSFPTVPYPEIERKMAAGLAECFIFRSSVLLGSMARMAHAQLIRKAFLNQLQGDKQNSVNRDLAA